MTELRAGVARVEITPSTFMPMYGYANRKCGPANGTHDPLFAKVLVLVGIVAFLQWRPQGLYTLRTRSLV